MMAGMKRKREDQKLTPNQREFCRAYVMHRNGGRAYRESYGKGKVLKDSTCYVEASRLLRIPKIQAEIGRLEKEADDVVIAGRKERLIWLSRVLRTPIEEVDETSDMCQEVTYKKNGRTVKMPSKLAVIQELNRMTDGYTPERVEVGGLSELGALLAGMRREPLVKDCESSGAGSGGSAV